jgi:hypothetical protein
MRVHLTSDFSAVLKAGSCGEVVERLRDGTVIVAIDRTHDCKPLSPPVRIDVAAVAAGCDCDEA